MIGRFEMELLKTSAENYRSSRSFDEELVKKIEGLSGYKLVYVYLKVVKDLKKYNHKKVYRHKKEINILHLRKVKKKLLPFTEG